MIDRLAEKARSRVAALFRIRTYLSSENMKLMYISFVRSIIEYGSVAWMGAASSHLCKLDRVQSAAQRIGRFSVEPLVNRRKAAAMLFAVKMLSGSCKGVLNKFMPTVYTPSSTAARVSRHTLPGIQIKPVINSKSLAAYRRSFCGALPAIWSTIPQDIIARGEPAGWLKIKSQIKNHLIQKCSDKKCERKPKIKSGLSELSIKSKPFIPKNTDINLDVSLYQQYMQNKADGVLII